MADQSVLLGICGGIAAYKTPELIRQLRKVSLSVIPVLTEKAKWFVTPQAIKAVSQELPYESLITPDTDITHLDLIRKSQVLVIAPATANSIAKFANGLADDLLSNIVLSFQGPKIIVPAMHTEMYENPITQRNIDVLRQNGFVVLGPDSGELACGDVGLGRMVDVALIVKAVQSMSLTPLNLTNKRIVITAGGTIEHIDSVRVISNLSSGKWGHELAHIASFYGADVTLITSKPVDISNPNLTIIPIKSVSDLTQALNAHYSTADQLYMMAAVSDYTVKPASGKVRRGSISTLDLVPTEDILAALPKSDRCRVVGFCLEPENRIEVAKEKLKRKGCDVIIANHPNMIGQDSRSFEVIDNRGNQISEYKNLSLNRASYELLKLAL